MNGLGPGCKTGSAQTHQVYCQTRQPVLICEHSTVIHRMRLENRVTTSRGEEEAERFGRELGFLSPVSDSPVKKYQNNSVVVATGLLDRLVMFDYCITSSFLRHGFRWERGLLIGA